MVSPPRESILGCKKVPFHPLLKPLFSLFGQNIPLNNSSLHCCPTPLSVLCFLLQNINILSCKNANFLTCDVAGKTNPCREVFLVWLSGLKAKAVEVGRKLFQLVIHYLYGFWCKVSDWDFSLLFSVRRGSFNCSCREMYIKIMSDMSGKRRDDFKGLMRAKQERNTNATGRLHAPLKVMLFWLKSEQQEGCFLYQELLWVRAWEKLWWHPHCIQTTITRCARHSSKGHWIPGCT